MCEFQAGNCMQFIHHEWKLMDSSGVEIINISHISYSLAISGASLALLVTYSK
jgi:hypothetical protein